MKLVGQLANRGRARKNENSLQIERDGTEDVLVGRETDGNHLCVVDDVSSEDEGTADGVDELKVGVEGEEGTNKASHEQRAESSEKVGAKAAEIVLALERIQSEASEDTKRDEQGLEDNLGVIECYNDADGECLDGSEGRQKNEVGRVRMALPVQESHVNKRADQCHQDDPGATVGYSQRVIPVTGAGVLTSPGPN